MFEPMALFLQTSLTLVLARKFAWLEEPPQDWRRPEGQSIKRVSLSE
jgi:hypothetical protein